MQNYVHKSSQSEFAPDSKVKKSYDANSFQDNRPQAIMQNKLQNSANNSFRSVQLKAFTQGMNHSQPIVQRATKVYNDKSQTYNFGTGTVETGSVMEVGLDPKDMKEGQSANLNVSQDEMMGAIRDKYGIVGGNVVKGHLWNDNLGGSALNKNLYPITKAANADHLGFVENAVKTQIWTHQNPVYYSVEVDAEPDINDPSADFDCEVRAWDPLTEKIGKLLYPAVTIKSDLNDVGAYGEAYETYTGDEAERQKRPRKPKWAKNPKTTVGALTKLEYAERLKQK